MSTELGFAWTSGSFASFGEWEDIAVAACCHYGEQEFQADPWYYVNRFKDEVIEEASWRDENHQVKMHNACCVASFFALLGEEPTEADLGFWNWKPGDELMVY